MVVPIYVITRLHCLQSRYLYNLIMVVNSMSTWLSCGAQIFGWTVIQMLLWRQLLSGVVFKGVDTEQSILPSTMCCPLFNQPRVLTEQEADCSGLKDHSSQNSQSASSLGNFKNWQASTVTRLFVKILCLYKNTHMHILLVLAPQRTLLYFPTIILLFGHSTDIV